MKPRSFTALLASSLFVLLPACSGGTDSATQNAADGKDPLAKLEITTAKATVADNIPLGTVPGQIVLPPEARVAVTAPFPGAAVRIFVIEGQAVANGQPLAFIKAAEPVQIRGDLVRSQAELDMAETQSRRMDQLASEGIIARARADEARTKLRQAHASVAENRRLASLAGAGADGGMTLRSPIAGRVAHVAIETGGPVDAMTAPFVIENAAAYRLDLQLPERLAPDVRPGMAIEVPFDTADGKSTTVTGQILSVAPSIDPATRSIMAKARIANAQGLIAGKNVMATISGPVSRKGVSVPSGAVTLIGGKDHVFVKTGRTFTPREVSLAADTGTRAVISNGLKAGEIVATSSIAELKAMTAE
ncbi:MAG: efflux RND transporter periplasmic adaptor subunit [Sphingobium sp.]